MKKFGDFNIKGYIILVIILLLTVFITIYFYMWYKTYEKDKLGTPILDDCLRVIQYNELDNYLVENKDAIIYVSVLHDEQIRNFEKKFRRLINKNLLNDILYLNISKDLIGNYEYGDIIKKYNSNVPFIVRYKNGNIVSLYSIKDNNYDVNLLKEYFIKEGVIND